MNFSQPTHVHLLPSMVILNLFMEIKRISNPVMRAYVGINNWDKTWWAPWGKVNGEISLHACLLAQ